MIRAFRHNDMKPRCMPTLALALGLALALIGLRVGAVEVRFEPVAPGIFAFVGGTGPRTPATKA